MPERGARTAFPAFAPIVSDGFEYLKDLPESNESAIGASLVAQGTVPAMVGLLRRGLVKLTHVNQDGQQTTLGLRTAGWFIGAPCVYLNTPITYSVTAVTTCTVSFIEGAQFTLKLMQSARMMRHFISTLCNEVNSQSAAQAVVVSESAKDRLAQFMRERNTEGAIPKTMDVLPLLKQMELAQLLAITPEHLSRILSEL